MKGEASREEAGEGKAPAVRRQAPYTRPLLPRPNPKGGGVAPAAEALVPQAVAPLLRRPARVRHPLPVLEGAHARRFRPVCNRASVAGLLLPSGAAVEPAIYERRDSAPRPRLALCAVWSLNRPPPFSGRPLRFALVPASVGGIRARRLGSPIRL
jgi:hypothetical protein